MCVCVCGKRSCWSQTLCTEFHTVLLHAELLTNNSETHCLLQTRYSTGRGCVLSSSQIEATGEIHAPAALPPGRYFSATVD